MNWWCTVLYLNTIYILLNKVQHLNLKTKICSEIDEIANQNYQYNHKKDINILIIIWFINIKNNDRS